MLYLITNRKLIKYGTLYSVVEKALIGGVDRVILREKDLSYKELLPIAAIIDTIIKKYNKTLIINNNIEVAKSLNTKGFHIGIKNFSKDKHLYKKTLGMSVHSTREAILAENLGADYILASHIYSTKCKESLNPRGPGFISQIKTKVNIPVIALGGINNDNIEEVLQAGADGIAVMSYIMSAKDPYKAAKSLKDKIIKFKNNLIC